MVFEICISIATIAFCILVFFIIQTLKTVQHSLKNIEFELYAHKNNINELILNSNETIEKVNDKIEDITPLVDLFSRLGSLGIELTDSIELENVHHFARDEKKKPEWKEKVFDLIDLTDLFIKVFQNIKKRK